MAAEVISALEGSGSGPLVGRAMEDLNVTLLAWTDGQEIPPHVNSLVDVVTVVLAGRGEAVIDGQSHELVSGSLVLLPKGCERKIVSRSDDFRYVNIHRRRPGLMPNMERPR